MPIKRKIRIPTILGIFLVIAGVFFTTLVIKSITELLSRTSLLVLPKNVRLTNLSDTKFTISFITDEPSFSFLNYGTSKSLDRTVVDDKNLLTGKNEPSTTHYFTVGNLKPETTYYFKIGLNKKVYGAVGKLDKISMTCLDFLEVSLNGEPFVFRTLPSKMITCRDVPLNGEVQTKQKLPAYGAIVCLEVENLLPVSDYVKANGKWVIPCYNLALKNLQDFLTILPDGEKEMIYIDAGQDGKTTVINRTGNDNPFPLIALGKETYDFSNTPLIAPINLPTESFPADQNLQPTTIPLILLAPKDQVADDLPTFRGKGKPNQVIKIEVQSDTPLSATVVIDENGNWSWTPPRNLSPGEHTVIITAIDEYGNQQVISQTFTIAGANPLLPITSGTQSAQPTIIPTIIQPTVAPTIIIEEPTPTVATQILMNTANRIPLLALLTFTLISFTVGLRLIFKM